MEGRGEVTIQNLVINTLRMRPDRIVVGEIRDAAALDMLQAMNTGHDGSMTTAHSNSARPPPPHPPPPPQQRPPPPGAYGNHAAHGRHAPAGPRHPRADFVGHQPYLP